MSNKILVTGVGIGQDVGLCQVCNYDLTWLVYYPSNLLWSDEILVASSFKKVIKSRNKTKHEKSIKLLFDLLETHGLIKIYNVSDYIDPLLKNMIEKQVAQDVDQLSNNEPSFHLKDDHFICLDNSEYCYPDIYSMYTTVILSKLMNATCLYNKRTKQFLSKKLNLCAERVQETESIKVLHELYNIYLPNPGLLPEYFFCDENKCSTCTNEKRCKANYLKEIEVNVNSVLEIRTRDELFQFRDFIKKHLSRKYNFDISGTDLSDIKNDIDKEMRRIKTQIKKTFPKYKRLINLVSFLTIPISVAGAFLSNNALTTVPLVSTGVVQSLKLLMDNYTNKNNWIAFYNK